MAQHFGDQIDITWKSFLLRPEHKDRPRAEFVTYSQGWQRMAQLEPRATFTPWADGTLSEPPSSSMPAHVAAKIVEAHWPSQAQPLHWALLEAYFSYNRTISDWDVLADIVAEVGIARSDFVAMLAEQRQQMAGIVIDDHNGAIRQGITAVPTVLVNNALPIAGAQESDAYIAWISRIIERLGSDS